MKTLTLFVFLFSFCPALLAQDINDVLREIAENNLSLQALQYEQRGDVAEAESRTQLSGASIEFSPFFRKGNGMDASELIVQQEFENPAVQRQRRRTTRATGNVGQSQIRLARREILWRSQQLCIDMIELNKIHAMQEERLRISEELLAVYKMKMAAGDATALDINKIKLDCMARFTELEKNKARRDAVRLELQMLNGGKSLSLDSLCYPVEHIHINLDELIEERSQSDAQLLSIAEQQKLEASLTAETRKAMLPKFSAGFRMNTEAGEKKPGFLVGMSLPVYSNRQQTRAAQSRQQATQIKGQIAREEMITEMRTLAASFQRYEASRKAFDLNLLRSSQDLLHKAVQMGEISVIDYYTEVEQIYEQWQTYYNLEHDCQIIHAQIHKNEL